MKVKFNVQPHKEQIKYRNCHFDAEDEVDFKTRYGWDNEYICTMKQIGNDKDNLFDVKIDEISRSGKSGNVKVISGTTAEESMKIRLALIHDLHFEPTDFIFL